MLHQPSIVITSHDLERLENLLNTIPNEEKDFAGKTSLGVELERAVIVDSKLLPNNIVSMNSLVRFTVSSSKESFALTLVYPKDMKKDGSTISILAPVGSAMLGLKEGDQIDWPSPDGKPVKVIIERVLYQPERSGDLHR